MVNPNAARHLALVVGVLLCFFVYMGYHIQTKRAIEENLEDPGIETAALSGSGTLPLMTAQGASGPEAGTPAGGPSGSSGASDVSLPLGLVPASSGDEEQSLSAAPDGLLAMADNMGGGASPTPSGSFEESRFGDDIITGLNAAPLAPPEAVPGSVPALADREEIPVLSPAPVPAAADSFRDSMPPGMTTVLSAAPPPAAAAPLTQPPPPVASAPETAPRTPVPAPAPAPAPVPAVRTEWDGQPSLPEATFPRGAEHASAPDSGASIRSYIIRPGDTLSRIATRELGSIALADNIYLLNRDIIFDPDQLTVGTKIRLPVRESVGAGAGQGGPTPAVGPSVAVHPGPAAPQRQAAEGARTYKVRRGDTLSSIALQFYGSSSGWRFLYQSNAAVIPNPDQLTVGTEIVIPPYGDGS